jgi:hypothetical protein
MSHVTAIKGSALPRNMTRNLERLIFLINYIIESTSPVTLQSSEYNVLLWEGLLSPRTLQFHLYVTRFDILS